MQAVIDQDGKLLQDPWPVLDTNQHSGEAQRGALQYWLYRDAIPAEAAPYPAHARLGLQLLGDEDHCARLNDLADLALLCIEVPLFTDGRAFSLARAARESGFKGDLRICGDYLPDQVHYFRRVGVSSFLLPKDSDHGTFVSSIRGFSDAYQAAVDQSQPLFRRRWAWSAPAAAIRA